ncbi:MAG: hypothetical protein H0T84_03575 [Tatlockia sp.]|nr:hypothetical protein [Tatlockia sp.]
MSNHKRKVVLADCFECYEYFKRRIQNNRFLDKSEQNEIRIEAVKAFFEIKIGARTDESVQQLQSWINRFVDTAMWCQCYRAINQKKYLAKNPHRTINLSDDAYIAFKNFTDRNGLTISDTIIDLIAIAESFLDAPTSSAYKPVLKSAKLERDDQT